MLPNIPIIQQAADNPAPPAAALPEIHVQACADFIHILPSRAYAQQQVLVIAVPGIDVAPAQTAPKGSAQFFALPLAVFPLLCRAAACIQYGAQEQGKARSTPPLARARFSIRKQSRKPRSVQA